MGFMGIFLVGSMNDGEQDAATPIDQVRRRSMTLGRPFALDRHGEGEVKAALVEAC